MATREDELRAFLRTLPDATGVRRVAPAPRSQPTIGPALPGNIPLPQGHAQELNPQHGMSAGDLMDMVLPVRPAAKLGYATAQQLHQGNVSSAAKLALAAVPLAVPGTSFERLLGQTGRRALAAIAGRVGDVTAETLPERYAIMTAENAGGSSLAPDVNAGRNAEMRAELERRGYETTPVKGAYTDPTSGNTLNENSFLVHGIGEREAKLLAKRYGQNGVITQGGYHDLVSGDMFPSKGVLKAEAPPYTELPNGQRLSLDIDWNTPKKSNVNALPVPKGFNPEIQRITQGMVDKSGGTSLPRVGAVDKDAARRMAKVYESLPTNDPAAKKSYDALNSEVDTQFKALQDQGYKFEFTKDDPYKNSQEMMADVAQNRRLKVFATPDDSFHPYMTPDQNNKFRAVHDLLAHAGEGHQFGPRGEENAYRVHMSTLSPDAQRALATETRGQNSWVNYGPNESLPAPQRPFAEQKAALWPANMLGDYNTMPGRPLSGEQLQNWRGIQSFLESKNGTRPKPGAPSIVPDAPAPTSDPYVRPGTEDMAIPASVPANAVTGVTSPSNSILGVAKKLGFLP